MRRTAVVSIRDQRGGWSVEVDEHRSSDGFAAAIWAGEPMTPGHRVVARIPQAEPIWDDEARAQTIADARLITAAPELLAALVSILRAFTDAEADRVGIEREDAWKARAGIPPWLNRIAAPAIAKARGGQVQAPRADWPEGVPADWRLLGCPHTASCVTVGECTLKGGAR